MRYYNQLTLLPDEDKQYAVEMVGITSQVTTSLHNDNMLLF